MDRIEWIGRMTRILCDVGGDARKRPHGVSLGDEARVVLGVGGAGHLARELAGVRLALADVVTTEDLREQLESITEMLEKLTAASDEPPVQ